MPTLKESLKQIAPRWRQRVALKNPEWIQLLNSLYPNVQLSLQIDALVNDRSPYCYVCSGIVKSLGKTTCSTKCRNVLATTDDRQALRIEKQKKTLLEKYGVENIAKLTQTQEKRKATMVEKYGALVSDKSRQRMIDGSKNLNVKGRETIKKKYGVNNPGQLPDHAEKCKVTMLKNYGSEHYSKSQQWIDFVGHRSLEKWKSLCPSISVIKSTSINDSQQYTQPCDRIEFSCIVCNKVDELPSETFKWRINHTGTACAECGHLNKGSNKENELRKYINQSLCIETENNVRILDRKEIDIYCSVQKVGFEFHGLFWHNDQRVSKTFHLKKLKLAEEKNIRLIQIFEDEWQYKKDIVCDRIRHILHVAANKTYYARKCQVKSVTSSDARKFLDANHIQGFANSSIKLGLYYEDELLSLMTFSKLTKAKGHISQEKHWELSRFCGKLNTHIVGAAGKLLKHFILNHHPVEILSFSDRRWSDGNLYKTLGFEFKGNTAVNYWYFKSGDDIRIHRYQLRKNSSDDQSLTEYENRIGQGYRRIWDCGSGKWVLNISQS